MAKTVKRSDKRIKLPSGEGALVKSAVRPLLNIHKGSDPDKYHPFRVQLLVQDHALLPEDLRPVIYYVRGPKTRPDLVATMADQLWQKWEKADLGLFSEYPDTRGYGFAEVCDEDDFTSAWKEAQKYKLSARVAGDAKDPMAFTCLGRTDL
jgi:hypothetical protein